ncbi:MAG: hypothetical protein IK094_00925 [Treponema sp.]|nr:hypothetical protein [Treponema sp.]
MKKILLACVALFAAALLFGQAKSTGLTDSDVQAFCKNFKKIESDFRNYDVDLSDAQALAYALDADTAAAKVLNKNGISGANAVDKVKAIAYGYVIARFEEEMAADPEAAKMLKALGQDPLAEVRGKVSDADQKVAARYTQELKKVFEN